MARLRTIGAEFKGQEAITAHVTINAADWADDILNARVLYAWKPLQLVFAQYYVQKAISSTSVKLTIQMDDGATETAISDTIDINAKAEDSAAAFQPTGVIVPAGSWVQVEGDVAATSTGLVDIVMLFMEQPD